MSDSNNVWRDAPIGGTDTYVSGFIGKPLDLPKTKTKEQLKKEEKERKKLEAQIAAAQQQRQKNYSNDFQGLPSSGFLNNNLTNNTLTTSSGLPSGGFLNADEQAKSYDLAGRATYYPVGQELRESVDWFRDVYYGADGQLNFKNNTGATPIVLLGNENEKIQGTQFGPNRAAEYGLSANSPMSFQEAISKTIREYASKENGYTELKNELIRLNYLSGAEARKSLSLGEQYDPLLGAALQNAIYDASNYNYNLAAKNKTMGVGFLSFNSWLKVAPKVGSGGSGGGSGDGSGTRVTYKTYDAADYDIAIDQLFQQTIGRGASKEELDFFVSRLQNYGNANPQTTVTKVSGDTTTATVSGGVSSERAASMMREQALAAPGAEEYNKATKYLDYLMEAISSPIQLG